ncbi:hypothetical protein J6590_075100 [Homalodisca vitripennis]|nr:hypothetical protein J6590_075100 [Homalodisca vitripennis]
MDFKCNFFDALLNASFHRFHPLVRLSVSKQADLNGFSTINLIGTGRRRLRTSLTILLFNCTFYLLSMTFPVVRPQTGQWVSEPWRRGWEKNCLLLCGSYTAFGAQALSFGCLAFGTLKDRFVSLS